MAERRIMLLAVRSPTAFGTTLSLSKGRGARLAFTLLLAVMAGCGRQISETRTLRIAVVPKGATHEHWKRVHAGALKAAQELGASGTRVEVIWKGPLREDDREQQIQVVENFISQKIDGIVLAPLDNRALVRPVEEARRGGIPTVIFDSRLESDQIVSYVSTDNGRGGELCAERMGQVLGGRGRVLMLRYQEGSAATEEREAGFVRVLKSRFPGVELISSDQYAGATRDTAKRASENLLNRYSNEIDGIYTPNESSTAGMLLALQDIAKAGRVTFVGFDASDVFVRAMKAGQLHGFVVQNPINMGYLSVKTMVDHLLGRQVAKEIDTGVKLITPENLDLPETREWLYPPVERYLK
jgi:ribose transport system substrate-binding protein